MEVSKIDEVEQEGFVISGIKCDHCDYKDMEVPFEFFPHYIDAPCPFCGHNLLTRADYNVCVNQYMIAWYFDSAVAYLKWLNPLHYWRLVFGDKRKMKHLTIEWNKNK